ncbi:MAG: hypothetical protein HAW63_05175 [Bdellovibrionaceae bacterium]|nr:hypothetical protein [Pseudobdellovibrionaceae bacterium]
MSVFKYWFLTYSRKRKGLHTKLKFNSQLNSLHLKKKLLSNSLIITSPKGQGLIEYLIIVGIMAVASLGAIRLLNKTVNSNFTNIIYSLQGKRKKAKMEAPKEGLYKKKDFNTFMNGAASTEK